MHAGLSAFRASLTGKHIELMVDNQPAVHMLRSMNTRSWACHREVLRVLRLARSHDMHLSLFWVPSKENLADAPSRELLGRVYCLPPWLASHVRSVLRP